MQQLEGFQYAEYLDINVGYYTIMLPPASQDMTTIVTEFGKFRYNRLHMGMCASRDILQAKLDELLGYIKGVKTHIHNIFVLIKNGFEKKIDHLSIIFSSLCFACLKVNAPKCSFGLNEVTYLCYVITRKGNKPDPRIFQGNMDLGQPPTTAESRALIGMVQ